MGSYRTPAAQAAEGQATLRPEDRPEQVDPKDWLGTGEWISYWAVMPYGTAADIAEVATVAVISDENTGGNRQERREQRRRRGNNGGGEPLRAEYRAGRAAVASFVCGLVDWRLMDESGTLVPYVPVSLDDPGWYERGKAIMSALPGPVVDRLQKLIDAGSEPPLDSLSEDAEHEGDTEGNVSGVS